MKLILLLFITIGAFADVNYLKKPFDENIQESFLNLIQDREYRNDTTDLEILYSIYLDGSPDKKKRIKELLNNDTYIESKIIRDETTGLEKEVKVKFSSIKEKFERFKSQKETGIYKVLMLDSEGKKEEADKLYFELITSKNKTKLSDNVNKLRFLIKRGNIVEAKDLFDKTIKPIDVNEGKKRINSSSKQINPIESFVIGDIYSFGSVLYFGTPMYEEYREKAIKNYGDSDRFNWVASKALYDTERKIDAVKLLENILLVDTSTNVKKEILPMYVESSKVEMLNGNTGLSWLQARRGLLISEKISKEERELLAPEFIKLKRNLKNAHVELVKELYAKREYGQVSRIDKETLDLISIKLIENDRKKDLNKIFKPEEVDEEGNVIN